MGDFSTKTGWSGGMWIPIRSQDQKIESKLSFFVLGWG
jgi:hypothetical protein